MPFIRTTVSKEITDREVKLIKEAFGRDIALVSGKAECYLMLSVEGGVKMAYQGDMDTPCALAEVQLLGEADPKELNDLTAAITKTLYDVLKIGPARIYVNYTFFKYWGVGGANV